MRRLKFSLAVFRVFSFHYYKPALRDHYSGLYLIHSVNIEFSLQKFLTTSKGQAVSQP